MWNWSVKIDHTDHSKNKDDCNTIKSEFIHTVMSERGVRYTILSHCLPVRSANGEMCSA